MRGFLLICLLAISTSAASVVEKILLLKEPLFNMQLDCFDDSIQITEIYSTGRSDRKTSLMYYGNALNSGPFLKALQEIYLSRMEIPELFINAGVLTSYDRHTLFRTDQETEPVTSPSTRVNDTIASLILNRLKDYEFWLGTYYVQQPEDGIFKLYKIKGTSNWRTGFSYNEWLVEQQISSDRADIHAVQYNGYGYAYALGIAFSHTIYEKLRTSPHYRYLDFSLGAEHAVSQPEYAELEQQININRQQRFHTVYQYTGSRSNCYSLMAKYGTTQLKSSAENISNRLKARSLRPQMYIEEAFTSVQVNLKDSTVTSINKWGQIWDQTTRERVISDFSSTTELTFTVQFLKHLFFTGSADLSISGAMERTGFDANFQTGLSLSAGGAFNVGKFFLYVRGGIPAFPEMNVRGEKSSLNPRNIWFLSLETAIVR